MKTIPSHKRSILLAIIWTVCVTLFMGSCAQIDQRNQVGYLSYPIDSGTETGDAGTQPIFEDGELAQYRCLRDPRGKSGIGQSDAPYQIWLDGAQLFNCYAVDVSPPCHAVGIPPLYGCSTEELVGEP